MTKVSYVPAEGLTHVEFAIRSSDTTIVVSADAPFTTSDETVQAELDANDLVTRKGKSPPGKD